MNPACVSPDTRALLTFTFPSSVCSLAWKRQRRPTISLVANYLVAGVKRSFVRGEGFRIKRSMHKIHQMHRDDERR